MTSKDGVKLFIYAAIQETWYKPLRDPTTFYNNVTAYNMLEFLCTNSGGDLATIPSDMLLLRQCRGHTGVHPGTRVQP